jgi:nicotinate-nucleotide pyrophosphorylase (carboxylating)
MSQPKEQLLSNIIRDRVAIALEEDLGGYGDITTNAIAPISQTGTGVIKSKSHGVLCGIDAAREVFTQLDAEVQFPSSLVDGSDLFPGTIVLEIKGSYPALLKGERTALNFLARLSGVATLTQKAVNAVAGTGVDILDTRKTTPGFRVLEKYAVRIGGGRNHRWGLFDQYLIKENHIKAAGGITAAVESARRQRETLKLSRRWIPESAHAAALGKPVVIEVEVRNLDEVQEALNCGADCILLDNMPDEQILKAAGSIGKKARVEISGGVTIEQLPQLAKLGVDAISMGALTHSAVAHDFSMLI